VHLRGTHYGRLEAAGQISRAQCRVKSGTLGVISVKEVGGENADASAWGKTQAIEPTAAVESWFSIPLRTGGADAGAELWEED